MPSSYRGDMARNKTFTHLLIAEENKHKQAPGRWWLDLVTVVQCSQCAMLPAHVRYQVKADKSTVAVSSQLSGEFPRQLSAVSAPVSSSSSRRVPASWQPRTGIRVAGVALSHARLRPRGSATCRQICTLDTGRWPLQQHCPRPALPHCPLQLPAPYYPALSCHAL